MIPMLSAALMVRAARTLPARRRDVVVLVSRPRGVVHVAVAPITPSGRFIPVADRTVCRAHTRRLAVVPRSTCGRTPAVAGRRVCSRCLTVLAARTDVAGLDGRPMTRDQALEAFELMSPAALAAVAETLTTVDHTHELGRLATILFGLSPMTPPSRRTPHETAVADLHDLIQRTRRRLAVEAMSPEEREAAARAREAQDDNDRLLTAQRRRNDARDRAIDRRNSGSYLMPHERALLNSA